MLQQIMNASPTIKQITLNIADVASILGAHPETIRRLAASGEMPAIKIGKSWRFLQEDLVIYMRSKYARAVTSQGAAHRSNKQWRFTKETRHGGLASPIKEKEYNEALGLPIK